MQLFGRNVKSGDYKFIVKCINDAKNETYGFSKPYFDTSDKNRVLIEVYATELLSCINLMNNATTQKQEGINKEQLITEMGGAGDFQDRFVRLHNKLKNMYTLAFSLAKTEIDDALGNYALLEAKYGSEPEKAGGKDQTELIRKRLGRARDNLRVIASQPAFKYIIVWDKDGEVLGQYDYALQTLRGVFRTLRMPVEF
jgi:hypothetical protein